MVEGVQLHRLIAISRQYRIGHKRLDLMGDELSLLLEIAFFGAGIQSSLRILKGICLWELLVAGGDVYETMCYYHCCNVDVLEFSEW